jgi:hypothetical protein
MTAAGGLSTAVATATAGIVAATAVITMMAAGLRIRCRSTGASAVTAAGDSPLLILAHRGFSIFPPLRINRGNRHDTAGDRHYQRRDRQGGHQAFPDSTAPVTGLG